MNRKITVTTGTRSEYGILRPLIKQIISSKHLKLYLIVCGMHLSRKHGFTINEIKKDHIPISSIVEMIPKQDTNFEMSLAVGRGIIGFSKAFKKIKPDINLILGDRDEALASAISAYHMNIPNAHIHGGDKTKAGIDEYNRHALTKISNIHFAGSKKSMQRILKMGEKKKYVFHTGSPSIDEISQNKITKKSVLEKKYKIKLDGNEILLLQHPVTSQISSSKKQITNTLNALSKFETNIITIAPNSDAGSKAIYSKLKSFSKNNSNMKLFPNLPRNDYLSFLSHCGVLVGNSSSGFIEGSYFKIPVVNIGIRQNLREGGSNIIFVKDFSEAEIHKAVKRALQKNILKTKKPNLYGIGNASKKITKMLEEIKITDELIQKQIDY